MKNLLLSFVFFTIILASCNQRTETTSDWYVAMKTDKKGNAIYGSKQKLINALRKGSDLKLGWGWKYEDKSLEHIAFPVWVGIMSEKEVYVYLDPQVLSKLDWDQLKPDYSDSLLLQQEWRVAVSTNGRCCVV